MKGCCVLGGIVEVQARTGVQVEITVPDQILCDTQYFYDHRQEEMHGGK